MRNEINTHTPKLVRTNNNQPAKLKRGSKPKLSFEEQVECCYLFNMGMKVKVLEKHYDICMKTVYNYINRIRNVTC